MEEKITGFINKHETTLQVVAFFVFPLICAILLLISALNLQANTPGLISSWVQWRVCLLVLTLLNAIYLLVVICKIELNTIYQIMVGVPFAMSIVSLVIWLVNMFIDYTFILPKASDIEAIMVLTIALQIVASFIWIK